MKLLWEVCVPHQWSCSCCHREDYRAMICVGEEIPSTELLRSVLKQKPHTRGQWMVVFISILFYALLWSNMKIIAIYEIRQQTRPRGVLCYVMLHPIHYLVPLSPQTAFWKIKLVKATVGFLALLKSTVLHAQWISTAFVRVTDSTCHLPFYVLKAAGGSIIKDVE